MITLRYCGTRFHGFQVQKNALSVQEAFQDSVEQILGNRPDIKGCSRTDAGVHANMFCLSMLCESAIPCDKLVLALNRYLPEDVAVTACRDMPLDFHARYDCTGKRYVYRILNSRVKDPFSPGLSYRWPHPLDEAALSREAADYVGTYDFSSFCSTGGDLEDRVRTIYSAKVTRQGEYIHFTVTGDGFLYNMVRIMAGTLLFISMGRIPWGGIPEIIQSKNRELAGKTMPAQGLFLDEVFYDDRVRL
ncbi:tRNA pseudouridine(38-40) synthase TruA [Oscillospiraceae bacterium MB08-C2-2]|nr:tRNA pseudouridine(38-40) synthase TruA [Oscillospiraceae bacterium MB08-C2-2]